jgi:surface protein
MTTRFASGKFAVGFCDRCNFRFKLTKLSPQVVKGVQTNILVCPECLDQDHPQLFLGTVPIFDPQALRNPRPDPSLLASRGAPLAIVIDTTLGSGDTFTLGAAGAFNIGVDWGDGTTSVHTSGAPVSHTYASPGQYTIEVRGVMPRLAQSTPASMITEVLSFGYLGMTSLASAFFGASNLVAVPNQIPYGITSLNSTFRNASSFNGDISNWDVSNVLSLSATFLGAIIFNQDIGSWNTSKVTNMQGVFFNAPAFNQDIGGWNTSSATNMVTMFFNASAFNQDLSGWCVQQIPTTPANFDTNAAAWVLPRPNWGAPC